MIAIIVSMIVLGTLAISLVIILAVYFTGRKIKAMVLVEGSDEFREKKQRDQAREEQETRERGTYWESGELCSYLYFSSSH